VAQQSQSDDADGRRHGDEYTRQAVLAYRSMEAR
jgi:hypothetical protein